jgi:hypothetical protein
MMSLMSANCSDSLTLSIADAATSAASLPKLLVLSLICGQHNAAMMTGDDHQHHHRCCDQRPGPAHPCLMRAASSSSKQQQQADLLQAAKQLRADAPS